jgi:hypothetical protein
VKPFLVCFICLGIAAAVNLHAEQVQQQGLQQLNREHR